MLLYPSLNLKRISFLVSAMPHTLNLPMLPVTPQRPTPAPDHEHTWPNPTGASARLWGGLCSQAFARPSPASHVRCTSPRAATDPEPGNAIPDTTAKAGCDRRDDSPGRGPSSGGRRGVLALQCRPCAESRASITRHDLTCVVLKWSAARGLEVLLGLGRSSISEPWQRENAQSQPPAR